MYEELNLEEYPSIESYKFSYASYNSVLNCLFLLTSDGKLILFDCNSRLILKLVDWSQFNVEKFNFLRVHNIQEKCIVVSDKTVCSRLANDGLFLLDTVFQPSSNLSNIPNALTNGSLNDNNSNKYLRTLELNVNDASILVAALKAIETESLNGLENLIQQIDKQLAALNPNDPWATIKVTETYSNFLHCLSQSLEETKRSNLHLVSIPIFALLLDRLYRLDSSLIETQIQNSMPITFTNFDKRYMCSEATRRATFNEWPHMDYKWVLPDALAQSGFYHQPTHPGDDRTICFVCDLCLVAWEQHDQPWSEHERHSPICQFVRGGEITENVPLSLTAATQSAHHVFKLNDANDKVECTSELSSERYFAVSNSTGHIIVYDSKDILKEMMHVQLINESQYNKNFTLKMHSLCFYYRNHKHVLYGSFTINDEVFIFSFNIFDIYRSYHSKSNKKSSKSHKSSTTTTTSGIPTSSSTAKATTKNTSTTTTINLNLNKTLAQHPPPTPPSQHIMQSFDLQVINQSTTQQKLQKISESTQSDFNAPKVNFSMVPQTNPVETNADASKKAKIDINDQNSMTDSKIKDIPKLEDVQQAIDEQTSCEFSAQTYINHLKGETNLELASNQNSEQKPKSVFESLVSNLSKGDGAATKNNEITNLDTVIVKKSGKDEETVAINNKTEPNAFTIALSAPVDSSLKNINSKFKDLSIFNTNSNENSSVEVFSLPMMQQTQPQAITTTLQHKPSAAVTILNKQPISASNLSNFLTVRFEIGSNQESTSKSKSKYKKCIKILSVSSKPLNALDSNTDIQLKTFEFTEKCLSFRLASIDLSSEPRKNFQISLVNLYEKFLCALVNFNLVKDNQKSFKLFRIKHEENSGASSSSTTSTANSVANSSNNSSTNSLTSLLDQSLSSSILSKDKQQNDLAANSQPNLPNCLAATSSSRLNLTEFVFTSIPSGTNINHKVLAIMPISVTTFEEDNDLKFITILTDDGTISIIDPIKCCKIIEFPSKESDKFVQMTYCYGIDKICAITENNKISLISTRVHPIINQSILDEMSGSLNFSELSLSSKNLMTSDNAPLTGSSLAQLHSLIYFDSTKLNFSAKLPFCWTPVLSEQQSQRKHPQHIHAESVNLTKSWRYINNTNVNVNNSNNNANNNINNLCDTLNSYGKNSKDDLNIEIYLNKPTQIGCIQLKLKLNRELDSNLAYELSLLTSRKYTESTKTIGSILDFNLTNNYNQNNKYELLYGPIDIREFFDTSNTKTYVITICSNKLYETRTNLFILNLKLKNNQQQSGEMLSSEEELSGNKTLNTNSSMRLLQKVQLTVRRYKRMNIPNENIERNLMLIKLSFFKNLMNLMLTTRDVQQQIKALDIINWIFYNNMSGSSDEAPSNYMHELKEEFFKHLDKFLILFYLFGKRSTSKKATILLNLLLSKLIDKDENFGAILLEKLTENLKYLPYFESSASMHYYFALIHQTMYSDPNKTYNICIQILTTLSQGHKYNPFYSLLKMRYNFSCLIFESKLFDIDLYFKFDSSNQKQQTNLSQQQQQQQQMQATQMISFGSVGLSVNNNLANNVGAINANTNMNPNQMIFNSNNNMFNNMSQNLMAANILNSLGNINGIKEINITSNVGSSGLNNISQSLGLLEVLPLNFKSISSSNGTSVDKNNSKQDTSLYVLPDYFGIHNATNPSNVKTDNNNDSNLDPLATKDQPIAPIDTSVFNSIFNLNPLQYLIVERMEPVSRHFVVLDFGYPVALTDIMIPACNELSSISVDIWLQKEQKDSKRICVSTEINQSPILLNDLQPPALCRFLKIIFVAHSTNIVKAKIPIGYFFGYPYIFHSESIPTTSNDLLLNNRFNQQKVLTSYLNYLEKLYEDNQCHYSMSIGKLRDLLNEINFPSDNIGHLKMMQFNHNDNNDFTLKIKEIYNECLDYQFQLNLNAQLIKRIRSSILSSDQTINQTDYLEERLSQLLNSKHLDLEKLAENMSQDQLRITNSFLLKTLLCLTCSNEKSSKMLSQQAENINDINFYSCGKLNLDMAFELFCNLCVHGNLEKESSLLLLRCCYNEPWWGEFISKCLRRFFVVQIKEVMPLSKIFITLNEICFKSLNGTQTDNLFRSLFGLIEETLKPLEEESECVEVTSLEWIMLFVSRLISVIDKTRELSNRWEFLENVYSNQKQVLKPPIRSKSKIKKKLFQSNKYFTWSKIKENRKNLDRYRKHLWKADNFLNQNNNENDSKLNLSKKIYLPRDISLSVGKLITKLLISANSYCSSDLFVLSCRIISSICCNTQQPISLSEIINKRDLNQLILLNVSSEFNHGSVCWGSPWSQHSLISLFMDVIENEKIINSNMNNQQNNSNNNNNPTTSANANNINNLVSSSSNSNNENAGLKIIEEIDEISSISAQQPVANSVSDAVKLTGNLANNFKQIAEMLSNHLNQINKINSTNGEVNVEILENTSKLTNSEETTNLLSSEKKYLNDLIENSMAKKLDEINKIMVPPSPQISFLTSQQSTNVSNLNKKIAQFQKQQSNSVNLNPKMLLSSLNNNNCSNGYSPGGTNNFKSSYDNRLDTSFYQTLENGLYIKMSCQNEAVNSSFTMPLLMTSCSNNKNNDDLFYDSIKSEQKSSIQLLQETIEILFEDLTKVNIENLLSFWLTLALSSSSMDQDNNSKLFSSDFYLKESTVNYLIETLLNYPFMTVKLWYLSFKTLTSLFQTSQAAKKSNNIAVNFSTNNSLYKFIYKFLSSNHELVGDECCSSLTEFLRKLSESLLDTEMEFNFKNKLFEVLCMSIENEGCMNKYQGPIDGQVTFVEYLISEDLLKCYEHSPSSSTTENINKNENFEGMFIRYFNSLAKLVQHHLCIYPRLSLKGETSPRSCFSGILTSLLFGSRSNNSLNTNNKSSFGDQAAGNSNNAPNLYSFTPYSYGFNFNTNTTATATTQSTSIPNMNSSSFMSMNSTNSQMSLDNKMNNFKSPSTQSVLCNRDILTCLLLKYGINLIADVKSHSSVSSLSNEFMLNQNAQNDNDSINKLMMDYQQELNDFKGSNTKNENETNGQLQQNDIDSNNTAAMMYEDDLLVQQLFLYELQQMDEMNEPNQAASSSSNIDQISQENYCELESDYENLPSLDNIFTNNIVNNTTNEKLNSNTNPNNNNNNRNQSNQKSSANNKSNDSKSMLLNVLTCKNKLNTLKNNIEINLKQKSLIKAMSNECLENFIESLALCQSSALAMVISNSGYPIELSLDDIQTTGDGLFVLLKSIIKEPLKLVDPLFNYLSKIKRLSEPLLWFFSSLFSNENVVRAFVEKGGIITISKGLALTTRQLLYSGPCVVSSLMNYIDTERQQLKALNNLENDSNEGFTNFAPFGSIICTSPSGNPTDVLVQNAAPHRRIRSAIWSYHFQPDEHKVGLFITFTYAFLLKEVQILPHTVSFGNCPAYVSVEVSRDGSFMSPIGPPIFTMGMSSIKLQLNKSELVNTVQINLYRSKDSQMIGLSQIRLLGYPMFENMLSAKPDMMLTPVEDLVSRSNMGWLRLLYISLTSIPSLENYVCEKIQDSTMLLCTRLLSSPAMIIYDKIIETILIKLSKHNSRRSLEITKYLLRAENGFNCGLYSIPHGILMETLINILYQISETSNSKEETPSGSYENTNTAIEIEKERIGLILAWLHECAAQRLSKESANSFYQYPTNMILHCVACILYKSKVDYVPQDMITVDYFQTILNYSINIQEYYTKQSVNWIICSLLYKKPSLIENLTSNIDLNILHNLEFDLEFKEASLNNSKQDLKKLVEKNLSLIETLSYAIQSTQVIQLFIKSKFFEAFNMFLMKKLELFAKYKKPIDPNYVKVYIALAEYEEGQNWLGSEIGCRLWQELIDLLCHSYRSHSINNSEEICLLVIQLIKKMLFLNIDNQNKFALFITKLIRKSSHSSFTWSINSTLNTSNSSPTISSFLHQIILQVLLDDQKITVNFERKSPIFKTSCNSSLGLLTHPRYGTGNNCRTCDLSLTKTCAQVISFISDIPFSQQHSSASGIIINNNVTTAATQSTISSGESPTNENSNLEIKDLLNKFSKSNEKDVNNKLKQIPVDPMPRIKLYLIDDSNNNEEIKLANELTLNKVLSIYLKRTKKKSIHSLNLVVQLSYQNQLGGDDFDFQVEVDGTEDTDMINMANSSPLDAFVKCDGLIVLAECLPILMPFIHEPLLNITDKDRLASSSQTNEQQASKTSPDFVDYVIMNESDEPFLDEYNEMPGLSSQASNQNSSSNKLKKITMPPHAFIAFGLFLKIPGYATVMLRNRRQAQCILKLLLGSSNRNGNSNSANTSTLSKEDESNNGGGYGLGLSTMPFTSLKELLNDARLSTDSHVKSKLTSFIFENGILTLILSILSALSHHPHRQKSPHFVHQIVPSSTQHFHDANSQLTSGMNGVGSFGEPIFTSQQQSSEDKNDLYWAKGTGFGTGSTIQQWDAEKTLMQQKMEEEHVTCIFEILSCYIAVCCQQENNFPQKILELFDHSCVINALSSYLRNDSVLDMSRHVPLYKSALRLLQSFILSEDLRTLIEKCNIFELVKNMKLFVDSYTQRIKLNEEGGLTCLVPVLNTTYDLVLSYIKPIVDKNEENGNGSNDPMNLANMASLDLEKCYCDMVKSLQFDTYTIIVENGNGSFKSNISYYYESCLNETANLNNANRAKRLAQETVTLSNSLPVSFSSSVFVRCDEERLDVMKVLITGPQDTPYENGCFEFDVFFPSDYPDSPPMINLQTTGNQTHRFNPNLYHDGKVCLSILNTWHGRPEERWNGQTSSFLQVLVSIQSLILVCDPYFNEPGYERSRGTPAGTASSIEYDANIRQATVKWAMLEMIKKPSPCFKEVVKKHFYFKRKQIKEQCERWLKEIEAHINDKQIGQSILKSSVALKRHMTLLFEELDKIKEEIESENILNQSVNSNDNNVEMGEGEYANNIENK